MNLDWKLFVRRWVIEDGNPEFHVGDVFEWSVAFRSTAILGRSAEHRKAALLLESNRYQVNAQVVYISDGPRHKCSIIDFGIMAISELGTPLGTQLPHDCKEGDYVAGEVQLELPLCFDVVPYNFDRRWRVNSIYAELTAEHHEIPGTDAVNAGSYLLNCSDLGSVQD